MPTDPVPTPTGRRLYFYAPHQDDETLWAGQIIAHHALVGREVHIVLGTDGSTSAIRDALNGVESNGWWGGFHFPQREGIPAPMSPSQFAAARDRELLLAAAQLGVPEERVHLRTDTRTANLTVDQAKALILANEMATPGAGHYTTWWGDPDPNHSALGQALRELAAADKVKDARCVVRRSQIGTPEATAAGAVEYGVPSTYAGMARQMVLDATRGYGAWNPAGGTYAIGEHSVHADLAWAASGASNVIVRLP